MKKKVLTHRHIHVGEKKNDETKNNRKGKLDKEDHGQEGQGRERKGQ